MPTKRENQTNKILQLASEVLKGKGKDGRRKEGGREGRRRKDSCWDYIEILNIERYCTLSQ